MQAGKRAKFGSLNFEAASTAAMLGELSTGINPNHKEKDERGMNRRGEAEEEDCGMEGGNEGVGEEMREGDGEGSDFSRIDEEDVEAEQLNYMNNFVAEVLQDLRSPDGVEDGLAIARETDPCAPKQFLQWLMFPLSVERFHELFWERRPFLIRRPKNRNLYEGWFEKEDIETLLGREALKYGVNLDVTKYKDGSRANFSTEGAAKPNQVWRKFAKGWSVRILHPQRWFNSVFLLLSAFERYWQCVAGCNAYLTPAGAQGFSPHYDDIDAFIIQTEGKKRWRCYRPRSFDEVLPRYSSVDFSQDDIGDPILDEELEAGDLLYMPRGTIHQAEAASNTHSLHLTVSVGQRNTWADYLELALPRALELASEDHIILRESLPRDFASYMGVAHSEKRDIRRTAFLERIMVCMDRLVKSGPWDSAVDQMAIKVLQARLPLPDVSKKDSICSEGRANSNAISMQSMVRLIAPDVARFIVDEDTAIIYHMLNNSRATHNEYREDQLAPEGCLDVPLECVPALEELMVAYPTPINVSSLCIDSDSEALKFVSRLCQAGLVVIS